MWKELLKSLLATLKSVLSRTSNARLGGLILGQIPHCKLQSNARGMPAGGGRGAVLVLTGTLFRILESGFCVHFKNMKMDYESKESILKL